ncbi:glycogen debranching protein GlgX [Demequina muriae]|uniref:Glycogen debranching protein GlgX n=1 Tax=Demequina muriae TaxID=3051664 RepID=A0ABT8GI84_9MICO|nr:glycogen debranching protein GlgX [Demequina sp. EGI L300058]MDN4481142.1 glycogen debranching protein GlgX [Demequina sp. EGI L300058]
MSREGVTPSPTPHRLGVHLVDGGAVVGVYAGHATAVDLCLFDDEGTEERVALHGPSAGVWHAFVPEIAEGQLYGFRAAGPWQPTKGHRYNPAKLLLDPYGRGIAGDFTPMNAEGAQTLLSNRDATDTAPLMPRSVVTVEPGGSWQTPHPWVPWEDTVIYELHVKGFTKQMEAVPEELRGTYAGLAHPASVEYLKSLGVTTIELLPVHAFASEPHLDHSGLSNYWGYSTAGFFAPHAPYATAEARARGAQGVLDEFVGMVDLLHQAGLEVILDVVYNHTAEAGWGDRVLSWRGLDNHDYYKHQPHSPGHYDDTTGTGNTLDFTHPRVVQMALDSLKFWVEEVGVDGFRFDLAVTLGRTGHGFSTRHPFLVGLTMDPVLGGVKLIAEPWDTGLGGWQVGNFPAPMTEWNDRFRDRIRSFWLTDTAKGGRHHPTAPELATRLAGSSDLFGHTEPPLMRGPLASVNFVTCHDGFTAHDLTAYNGKHNEANEEDNRDGTDNNRSWNHGYEGPTGDEDILALRRRSIRNLLGTTLLSAGTPMLLAGDEFGNSQGGNNNAYCQDNEISWLDWEHAPWQEDLRATVAHVVGLRRAHQVLRPATFYEGRDPRPDDTNPRADSAWFASSGEPETEDWWEDPATRVVQFMRSLSDVGEPDALLVINGWRDPVDVTIPFDDGKPWRLVWDSAWETPEGVDVEVIAPGQTETLEALTVRLYLSEV